jgi:hypothetical protein
MPQVLQGGGVRATNRSGQAVDAKALDAACDGGLLAGLCSGLLVGLGLPVGPLAFQPPQLGEDLHPGGGGPALVDRLSRLV